MNTRSPIRPKPSSGLRPLSLLAMLLAAAASTTATAGAGAAETGDRPLVIAHRGASGYLPEHTLPAYALAVGQGADYVEPDLVLSRDGHFVCLHDIHLEATTDVEERFPDRRREDGRWYAADFSLEELRALRAHERLEGRFPQELGSFSVPTFLEMLDLVQGLERTIGRRIGIYPELKAPRWHREHGLPMEERFLALVRERGYRGSEARIFVQSFEPEALRRLRNLGSELPQVLLLSDDEASKEWLDDEGLASTLAIANGIGPAKTLLLEDETLVRRAHAAGLLVHPYTFRADDLPPGTDSLEAELERFFLEIGVDGLFTDFPDRAARWVDGSFGKTEGHDSGRP